MFSRREVIAAVQTIARRADGRVRSTDLHAYAPRLYQSLLHHFGSLPAARWAAGVPGPPRPRRWTQDKVLAELKRLHRAGIRITHADLIKAGRRDVANAARDLFGGLPRARREAKISKPARPIVERVAWDEDTVVSEIRARHRESKPLAQSKAPRKLLSAAGYYFGGWREAVEASGLDYDRVRLVREPYQPGEVLDLLRGLARRRPDMTLGELHDHSAVEAVYRHFGSIEAAARRAGVRDWPVRRLGPLGDADEVIATIGIRHAVGRSLRLSHVEREDARLLRAAVRHFGTWDDALRAAGIAVDARLPRDALLPRRKWERAAVIDALLARRAEGKPMHPSAVRADDHGLYDAAKRELGYDAEVAVRDWGATRKLTRWTKPLVIRALREAHRSGSPLLPRVARAAGILFGSMIAARKAARLPLPRTVWDDARVVREIRALRGARPSGTLVSIAQRRFGSWRAALVAAGVPARTRHWDPVSIRAAVEDRLAKGRSMKTTGVLRDDPSLYYAVHGRYGAWGGVIARFIRTGRLARR